MDATLRGGVPVALQVPRNCLSLCGLPSDLRPPAPASGVAGRAPFRLRPYQFEAAAFAQKREGCLFFHDLGLGKTAAALYAATPPIVVVCPNNAVYGWRKAAEAFDFQVKVLHEGVAHREDVRGGEHVFVIPYGSSPKWLPFFRSIAGGPHISWLIADEVHTLHRKGLKWSEAFRGVERDHTLGLSATPLRNRMPSLWGALDTVSPRAWGTRFDFLTRYSSAEVGAYGLECGELSNVPELAERMSSCVVRKTYADADTRDLRPPLERFALELDVDTAKVTDALWHLNISSEARRDYALAIRILTEQRHVTGRLKVEYLEGHPSTVDSLLAPERSIWWVWFKDTAERVQALLRAHGKVVTLIDGDTPDRRRDTILADWEDGDPDDGQILVATMASMSAACNLLTARRAVFIEFDYAPINQVQAEARHHRPGNVHAYVESFYLSIKGTTDDDICRALLKKLDEEERLFGSTGRSEPIRDMLYGTPEDWVMEVL